MDVLLYGQNDEQGVVAVQHLTDSEVRIYSREPDATEGSRGNIVSRDVKFFPFFFLSDSSFLQDFTSHHWLKELSGSNHFRYIAAFSRWSDMWDAVRNVLVRYNRTAPKRAESYSEAEVILLKHDPIQQFLLQSGITLFKGMAFDEVYRMQIDLKTASKTGRISDPRRTEDKIVFLTLTDNRGWTYSIEGSKSSEESLLKEFVSVVGEKDPDVIEGHHLFGFQLPYVIKRAELLDVDLALGRDGSSLKSLTPQESEMGIEGGLFEIPGRHLIDTMHLAQAYDFARRSTSASPSTGSVPRAESSGSVEPFESNSVLHIAEQLGFHQEGEEKKNRRTSQHRRILHQSQEEAVATRFIADHLAPSSFYLTQMCPMQFGAVVRTGSAVKIELLLLREYIRQKQSIPKPQQGSQTTGGYTDIFLTGVAGSVVQADVESLYPSIIVSPAEGGLAPATDELRIFPRLLQLLLSLRLEAKKAMHESTEDLKRMKADALQSSLKILINSFYGYLGYGRGLFNDYAQADVVTKTGQQLLREIIQQVTLYNGTVVEVDTDGIFFIPPDNVLGEVQERAFVERISNSLPDGIRLAYAGRYKKMLSYKKKNYALLSFDGDITIKGSSLSSRSLEPFCRQYIRTCIAHLLHENVEALHQAYVQRVKQILAHHWVAADFARTETFRDSLDRYEAELTGGTRNPSAAYEVAKRSGRYVKPGERISYYVTGTHPGVRISENSKLAEEWDPNFPDENTHYYLGRINECSRKFESFFTPEDFNRIFSQDDLFGFDPQTVRILTKPVLPEETPASEEQGDFGIWLDEE